MEEKIKGLQHGILNINSHLASLKPAEKKVAEYILDNVQEVIHLSITKLARKVGVSEATIVKFCQHVGYSGYQQLKIILARAADQEQQEHIYGEIDEKDKPGMVIKKIFQIYNQSLRDTEKLLLQAELEQSRKLILQSHRIFIFGFGASGLVALDTELKFKRLNYLAEAITDNHNQKTVASLLGEDDLVIGISDSGRTRELVESLNVAKEAGARIIAITSNIGSPVAKLADLTLLTSSRETPFRGSAIASRMSQLAVIDVLFLIVATADFSNTLEALNKTRVVMQESKLD